jgi:hypothetical protein
MSYAMLLNETRVKLKKYQENKSKETKNDFDEVQNRMCDYMADKYKEFSTELYGEPIYSDVKTFTSGGVLIQRHLNPLTEKQAEEVMKRINTS